MSADLGMERLRILAEGSQNPFWIELRAKLLDVKRDALENLMMCPPEDTGKVAEFQQMARQVDMIVRTVDGARQELNILEGETKHG